jgi:branched-subunit amino acid aminotransferase/4-amino-4-deoxychorismate lyase
MLPKEPELIETVRVEERGKPALLHYHYQRLRRGAISLGYPFSLSFGEFKELFQGYSNALVRFSLSKDGSWEIKERELLKREEVRLKSVFLVSRSPSPLSRFKTSLELEKSLFALSLARESGCDEALLYLSGSSCVSECSFANIFFVKEKTLFTPSLSSGCLEGTRRKFFIYVARLMGLRVCEGLFEREALLSADEVFITSAREDCVPVSEIDGIRIKRPPVKSFCDRFKEIVKWQSGYGRLPRV